MGSILTCAKAELYDLTVCTVVNGEKNSKSCRDLDLDRQSSMSKSSELFSYTTICSSFK